MMNAQDVFTLFVKDRVRMFCEGYPTVLGQTVTLKEIVKAYNRWALLNKHKKIEAKVLEDLSNYHFGQSKTQTWNHLAVFLDDEDVEEFDKEHSPKKEPPKPRLPSVVGFEDSVRYMMVLYTNLTSVYEEHQTLLVESREKPEEVRDFAAAIRSATLEAHALHAFGLNSLNVIFKTHLKKSFTEEDSLLLEKMIKIGFQICFLKRQIKEQEDTLWNKFRANP
jgi:hypothetical protein